MEFKNFQIIIGSIFIGLSIILGSVIYSNNSGFNACYEQGKENYYDKNPGAKYFRSHHRRQIMQDCSGGN